MNNFIVFLKNKKLVGPLVVTIIFTSSSILFNFKTNSNDKNQYIDPGFTLKESSAETHVKFRHRSSTPAQRFKNIHAWISSVGATVAVADINNDGFQDIFFNDSSAKNEHALFINQKNGTFENQISSFKLNNIKTPKSAVTRAVFFDCNNDHYPELFLIANPPRLFFNHNGQFFEDITEKSGLPKSGFTGFAANVFDYNNDGNLDLIYGSYFSSDIFSETGDATGILPYNFIASKNKANLFLMKGDGKCQFNDDSHKLPTNQLRGWYFSISIQDLYNRGKQDIFIASDFGIDHLLLEDENKNIWIDKSSLIDHASLSKNGMGVVFSDVSHTQTPYAYTSNIFRNNEQISGNLLWKFDKNKSDFVDEVGRDYNVSNCGWSWGAQFVDLNVDSWDDLIVTNGFIGTNTQKNYWYNLSVLEGTGRNLISDYKNWPDMKDFQLEGGQRDCVFVNRGNKNKFDEVTVATDFDVDEKNGRGIAYIDINNDGNYSLILSNQNDEAHIYKVKTNKPYNWIGISLIGKKSNISGYGAKIFWILSDGSHSYKEIRPLNGFSAQSDPRFRLAFDQKLTVKEIYIIWPTQKKQTLDLDTLTLNQYHIISEQP